MKFIQIALVIVLILCSVESRRVRRRGTADNIKQFILGMLTSIAGPSGETFIKECLPASLQNAGTDESSATSELAGSSTAMQIITKVGKVAIGLMCKFKSKVLDKLLKLVNRRRFFIMSRASLRRSLRSVARKMRSRARRWGLPNPLAIVDKIVSGVKTAVAKVRAFFQSKTFEVIKQVFQCVQHARGAARHVVEVVKGLASVVQKLAKGVPGVIEVLLDCICNYSSFATAIDHLVNAIKKNGLERVNYIGRFVGQLFVAVAGK